jgi:cytochrome c oxidase assembly factor CtaG
VVNREQAGYPGSRALAALSAWAVVVGAAVWFYAGDSGADRFAVTGSSFPGAVASVAEFLGSFLAGLAGAFCFGILAVIVISTIPDDQQRLGHTTYRLHLWVERVAVVWLVTSAAMVGIDAANAAGAPLSRVLAHGAIGDALAAAESARGWVVAAASAGVLAIGIRLTLRWVGHLLLLVPAGIGVVAPAVTGNAGEGPDHDTATGAAIVFTIVVAVLFGLKVATALRPEAVAPVLRRTQLVAFVAGVTAVIYGALLLSSMLRGTVILDSGFGRFALLAWLLLVAVTVVDLVLLLRRSTPGPATAVASAAAVVAALGAISTIAILPPPRFLVHKATVWDVFLGYELPGPVTVLNLLTCWRLDPLFGVAALAMALAYAVGVIALRRRGDSWPVGRTVAWVLGCLALLIATNSGLRAYGSAMFSVHMAEHMVLNMFIPVLLVLGAPVTLALRALPAAPNGRPPGPREWTLWMIHAPATRFLANPIVAFVLFVGSPFFVYFTPLFDTLIRYHWGHELMTLHFLLVGYLYYWGIIGIDPGPRRLPFLARLGLLFAVMPFHAFFGIATMTMNTALGSTFYGNLALPWLSNLSDDQHLGGAIAWGSSEVPVVIVVIALVTQWARQDRRAGARHDRHTDSGYDDDLDAYNAMLRELSRNRE